MNKKMLILTFICNLSLYFFSSTPLYGAAAPSPRTQSYSMLHTKKEQDADYSQSFLLGHQAFNLSSRSHGSISLSGVATPSNSPQAHSPTFSVSSSSEEITYVPGIIAPPSSPQTGIEKFVLSSSEEESQDGLPPYPFDLKIENQKIRHANQELVYAITQLEKKIIRDREKFLHKIKQLTQEKKALAAENRRLVGEIHKANQIIPLLYNVQILQSEKEKQERILIMAKSRQQKAQNHYQSILFKSQNIGKNFEYIGEEELFNAQQNYTDTHKYLMIAVTKFQHTQRNLTKATEQFDHFIRVDLTH